jgi:Divergent InlB B-repeat domain
LIQPLPTNSAVSSVTVNGPGAISGIFDPLVTINAGSGGTIQYLDPPFVGTLQSGQSITFYAPTESVLVLTAQPSTGYSFQTWNSNLASGVDASSSILQLKITSPASLSAQFMIPQTTITSVSSGSTQTAQSSSINTSSSTARIVTIPSTNILPTRNVALDIAAAVIVALVISLAIIVVLSVGSTQRRR